MHLLLRYEIDEGSVAREDYRFQVESDVGGVAHEELDRHHKDVPVSRDTWYGTLGHRYRFDQKGTYEGRFRAVVTYGKRGWFRGRREQVIETVEVPVRIDVV